MKKDELELATYNYRRKVELASAWTNDTDALECIELFPRWTFPKDYIIGERVQYEDLLYKCIQAHTSQEDWKPTTQSLWVKVSVEEYPQWVQPTGSADAYNLGDKVTYNSKHYISIINANVWSPDVYGWQEEKEG